MDGAVVSLINYIYNNDAKTNPDQKNKAATPKNIFQFPQKYEIDQSNHFHFKPILEH